jgi:hypothetical protein
MTKSLFLLKWFGGEVVKTRFVQKVKNLQAPQRRCLEKLLGRPLDSDEEITLVASGRRATASNGRAISAYEAAKRSRIIGIVKNAPSDLSTNKKYLEGLGGR